ncbi:MAG TPA: cation diffusion facilitator family transporter [Ktedonobacterales bacterium]
MAQRERAQANARLRRPRLHLRASASGQGQARGQVHSHAPLHDHGHSHYHAQLSGQRLRYAFLLALLILVVELVGGLLSHSLAVLSDGAHMLTDVAALGLAWFAAVQAQRPSNDRWTYGYHRIGILTALVNGASLVIIAVLIGIAAYARLLHPTPVEPGIMLIVAVLAIALNLVIVFVLQGDAHNLNSRAALLHVIGDIGASAAVIVGALLVVLTGALWVDPVLSLLIAALIAVGAVRLIKETIGILLNATPRGVEVQRLAGDMCQVEGVRAVHDLHIWAISSGMNALSSHVVIDDLPPSQSALILDRLGEMLRSKHRITHTTIQFESTEHGSHTGYCACPPGVSERLYCEPEPVDEGHDDSRKDDALDLAPGHA